MSRFDRRAFLAGGLAVSAGAAAGGILAGTDEVAGAITNGPGRNGISRSKPHKGGSLVFGTDAEEQGFDPTTARFDEVGVMYARTVFDSLTAVTKSGGWVPYLAQSVVPNDDYTSWTITLRPNIHFSDGTPLDGAALEFNLQKQAASLLTGPAFATMVQNTTQTGPLSVRIDVKSSWVPFPYYLATQVGYVAAPSMLRSSDGTIHPVGTGPFHFQEWVQNDHFTATRNPHYWRSGYPYLDKITFKPIPDSNARAEALQSGAIDIMITSTPQQILQFRGNKQWAYVDDSGPVIGEPDMSLVMLNTAAPPFDDPDVRLAMAKSVNNKEYAKVIDLGVCAPSNGPFVRGTPYYRTTSFPKYDPAGSRRLVKAYEHKHHKPLSFTLGTIPTPYTQQAASFLQERYEQVGMKVQQASMQQTELIDNALSGSFQAYTWRQFGAAEPDLNYVFWSQATVEKSGISLNMARNGDPRIQAALLKGRETTTASTRYRAYQQVSEYLAQDLPYLWGDRTVWAVAAEQSVQNFVNPVAPNGAKLLGNERGSLWPTQIWIKS